MAPANFTSTQPQSRVLAFTKLIWKQFHKMSFSVNKFSTFQEWFVIRLYLVKGIYLSKALTCMKLFLYKQTLLFYQGDGYLWLHCCMNNLYIPHRSFFRPNIHLLSNRQHAYQSFRVTSWFDTVLYV